MEVTVTVVSCPGPWATTKLRLDSRRQQRMNGSMIENRGKRMDIEYFQLNFNHEESDRIHIDDIFVS